MREVARCSAAPCDRRVGERVLPPAEPAERADGLGLLPNEHDGSEPDGKEPNLPALHERRDGLPVRPLPIEVDSVHELPDGPANESPEDGVTLLAHAQLPAGFGVLLVLLLTLFTTPQVQHFRTTLPHLDRASTVSRLAQTWHRMRARAFSGAEWGTEAGLSPRSD